MWLDKSNGVKGAEVKSKLNYEWINIQTGKGSLKAFVLASAIKLLIIIEYSFC